MQNKTRKHYRVAMRQVREDPYAGMYVTKDDQKKCFLVTVGIIALSMLSLIPLILKSKQND